MVTLLLVIFGILFETIIIIGGIYLVKKQITTSKRSPLKVLPPIIPPPLTFNKKTLSLPYDSIYTPSTSNEKPIKRSDGDLIPYNLSDNDRDLLEMFYGDN